MSLTQSDLQQIKVIVNEAVQPLKDELEALRSDIKEIYDMIAELQGKGITDIKFQKLSIEEKLLTLNAELVVAAKQAGITLPRS